MAIDTSENERILHGGGPEQPDGGHGPDVEENANNDMSAAIGIDQGHGPNNVYDIEYIGKSCFTRCECVVLIAKVKYCRGDGRGIMVEFKLGHEEFRTRTLEGGVAYVVLGLLEIGEYHGRVKSCNHSDNFEFIVGTCIPGD